MREIGRIALLQVLQSTVKLGEGFNTYYDPTPILAVEKLLLSPQGVIGLRANGQQVMDVHHVEHPASRNRGNNGVSLGFTSHYATMRRQFGDHLANGIAGDNIVIETERIFARPDLGNKIAIRSQEIGQFVSLTKLRVAAPCVEFAEFAANAGLPMSGKELKIVLQFLNDGRRGFYATVDDQSDQMIIQIGDKVFADDGE
jgi:hypothetical protein